MATPLFDDVEKIRSIDKSGMIDFCVNAAKHYRKAAKIAQKITAPYPKPDNIIIAGMGGSAIGGDLLKDWAKTKSAVPIEVNRDYHLPAYANQRTLVLIISYSGDTEESLSSFHEALQRKCMVFCVSSGGALLKYAERHRVPFLRVPEGMPPRAALPYLFVPLLMFLEKAGLVLGATAELEEAFKLLETISIKNAPEKPLSVNPAKTLALSIGDAVPVIYGHGVFRSVAQRFKQQFNENSKLPSKWEVFPELDHNEIVGWEGSGKQGKCFYAVFIRDDAEPVEIHSRIETTKQIMGKADLRMFEVQAQGKGTLAKMLSIVVFGDFVSVYLALLRGVDPTPVKTISFLKDSLAKNGVKEEIIADLERL